MFKQGCDFLVAHHKMQPRLDADSAVMGRGQKTVRSSDSLTQSWAKKAKVGKNATSRKEIISLDSDSDEKPVSKAGKDWACQRCSFHNTHSQPACEMCEAPKPTDSPKSHVQSKPPIDGPTKPQESPISTSSPATLTTVTLPPTQNPVPTVPRVSCRITSRADIPGGSQTASPGSLERIMVLEVSGAENVIQVYGVTAGRESVCLNIHGFHRYLYVACDPAINTEHLRTELNSLFKKRHTKPSKSPANTPGSGCDSDDEVIGIDIVQRQPLLYYRGSATPRFARITIRNANRLNELAKILRDAHLEAASESNPTSQSARVFFNGDSELYESNVTFELRFMVDAGICGGSWIEFDPASAHPIPHSSPEPPMVPGSRSAVSRVCDLEWCAGAVRPCMSESASGADTATRYPPTLLAPLRSLSVTAHPAFSAQRKFTPSSNVHGPEVEWSEEPVGAVCLVLSWEAVDDHESQRYLLVNSQLFPSIPPQASTEVHGDVAHPPDSPRGYALIECANEAALLKRFRDFVVETDPDIVVGYGAGSFDIALLHTRAQKLNVPNFSRYSRCPDATVSVKSFQTYNAKWAASQRRMSATNNEESGHVRMDGRLFIDMKHIVQGAHKLSTYSLEEAAEVFLDAPVRGLLGVREAGQMLPIQSSQQFDAFVASALVKTEHAVLLMRKLTTLTDTIELARVTGINIETVYTRGQMVRTWSLILREAQASGYIVPSQRHSASGANLTQGPLILDPITGRTCGLYQDPVVVLDFTAMYPSIMIARNICYSTLLHPSDRDKYPQTFDCPEPSIKASFVDHSVREGLLPCVLRKLLKARSEVKSLLKTVPETERVRREVLDARQKALKICANALFGFTGTSASPLCEMALAETVLAFGRQDLGMAAQIVRQDFPHLQVIYGDTDSLMVRCPDMTREQAKALGLRVSTHISELFPSPCEMKFENVFQPFLLQITKHYAGGVMSPSGQVKIDAGEDLALHLLDLVMHPLVDEEGDTYEIPTAKHRLDQVAALVSSTLRIKPKSGTLWLLLGLATEVSGRYERKDSRQFDWSVPLTAYHQAIAAAGRTRDMVEVRSEAVLRACALKVDLLTWFGPGQLAALGVMDASDSAGVTSFCLDVERQLLSVRNSAVLSFRVKLELFRVRELLGRDPRELCEVIQPLFRGKAKKTTALYEYFSLRNHQHGGITAQHRFNRHRLSRLLVRVGEVTKFSADVHAAYERALCAIHEWRDAYAVIKKVQGDQTLQHKFPELLAHFSQAVAQRANAIVQTVPSLRDTQSDRATTPTPSREFSSPPLPSSELSLAVGETANGIGAALEELADLWFYCCQAVHHADSEVITAREQEELQALTLNVYRQWLPLAQSDCEDLDAVEFDDVFRAYRKRDPVKRFKRLRAPTSSAASEASAPTQTAPLVTTKTTPRTFQSRKHGETTIRRFFRVSCRRASSKSRSSARGHLKLLYQAFCELGYTDFLPPTTKQASVQLLRMRLPEQKVRETAIRQFMRLGMRGHKRRRSTQTSAKTTATLYLDMIHGMFVTLGYGALLPPSSHTAAILSSFLPLASTDATPARSGDLPADSRGVIDVQPSEVREPMLLAE